MICARCARFCAYMDYDFKKKLFVVAHCFVSPIAKAGALTEQRGGPYSGGGCGDVGHDVPIRWQASRMNSHGEEVAMGMKEG